MFVAFLKAYFEFLEDEGNPLWYSRRLSEIKDIDETLEEFILHFKEKYLKNIPLTSYTDARMLIKHSLDLYRSKGTERGIDLLFKLIYGVPASVYFPNEDIFRLSDGRWVIPRYLEVSLAFDNTKFVNKQIRGLKSGAVAFVERVVRRTSHGKLIDVLYISAINGTFLVGETINTTDEAFPVAECPAIVGSLGLITVDPAGVGIGFSVGDIVDVSSTFGNGGKAKVTEVLDIFGIVVFEPIISYGFGYSNTADVFVSESVLTLSNVQPNTMLSYYWKLFERVEQPKVYLNYTGANGAFAVGDTITTYEANNAVRGTGKCYNVATTNSTAGTLRVFLYSGNLNHTAIYNGANAVGANLAISNGYTNATATGNVMGISTNLTLQVVNSSAQYVIGEQITAVDSTNTTIAHGKITNIIGVQGGNSTIFVANTSGFFNPNTIILGRTSLANGILGNLTLDLALKDITGTFVNNEFNFLSGNVSNSNATIQFISTGLNATMNVRTNNMIYNETANINSDLLRTMYFVPLDGGAYGFPANATANSSTNIALTLSYSTVVAGKPIEVTGINPGSNYNKAPFVIVYDELVAGVNKEEILLEISNLVGAVEIGEVVTQSATNAKGLLKVVNSSFMALERICITNNFIATTNSTTIIAGEASGFTANVISISANAETDAIGLNFAVQTSAKSGTGAISKLAVVQSGFGYVEGEDVMIVNEGGDIIVDGIAGLAAPGFSEGYYQKKGGFLSDQKKLYDGYYYQEFSYDVRSAVTLDKYKDILKNVMHFAGTQMFGALQIESTANVALTVGSANVSSFLIDDYLTATGTVPVNGAAAITEANDTSTAAGTIPVNGAAAITEAGDTVSAAGTVV